MTARKAGAAPATIRPLEPRDRQAVRDICCKTAFRNMGSDALFEDREVHADYWTSYYTDHDRENCWVIEQNGEIIGYFLGCDDHARFARVMGWRIVPWATARAIWRALTGRYKNPVTRRYLYFSLFRAWREIAPIDHRAYPAHYHCNILRKGYGRGYYTLLTLMFLDRLEAKGVTALHGHITEPKDKGIWDRFGSSFRVKQADVFTEKRTEMFRYLLGDETEMVNRSWGIQTANYRLWIEWLRDRYRL